MATLFVFPVLAVSTVYSRRFFIMLWLLFLGFFSSLSYAGMIDKEGMQPWEICAMCHNANGISRMAKFPKLAGQKAAYIEQQVIAFREGRRQNDGGQMQAIVGEVARDDVAQIAAYFSTLPQDTQFTNEAQQLEKGQAEKLSLGQSLFLKGREGIASCAGCHAEKASNAPWLDGQHRQYLEKQLHDFNSGERESHCAIDKTESGLQIKDLTSNSERLEDAEIEALALYLSTLSLQRQ